MTRVEENPLRANHGRISNGGNKCSGFITPRNQITILFQRPCYAYLRIRRGRMKFFKLALDSPEISLFSFLFFGDIYLVDLSHARTDKTIPSAQFLPFATPCQSSSCLVGRVDFSIMIGNILSHSRVRKGNVVYHNGVHGRAACSTFDIHTPGSPAAVRVYAFVSMPKAFPAEIRLNTAPRRGLSISFARFLRNKPPPGCGTGAPSFPPGLKCFTVKFFIRYSGGRGGFCPTRDTRGTGNCLSDSIIYIPNVYEKKINREIRLFYESVLRRDSR